MILGGGLRGLNHGSVFVLRTGYGCSLFIYKVAGISFEGHLRACILVAACYEGY